MVETDKPFCIFSLEADRDYLLARVINFAGSGFASRAGYSGQQALEKYMKACLVQKYQKYPEIHDLIKLAAECKDIDPLFTNADFLRKLKKFDDFWDVGRYGGAAKYDPHSVGGNGIKTAGSFSWSDTDIKILDELVFFIRGKLDYGSVGFKDSLTAILNNDRSERLVSSWKLPIPLSEILSTGNNFFKPETKARQVGLKWKPTTDTVLSVVAILVSLVSVAVTFYIFKTTLPLSSANLVFSEEKIQVTYFGTETETKEDDHVQLVPSIQNDGLSPASDVHFKTYILFEDKNLSFKNTSTALIKSYDDQLAHLLQPGSKATFGASTVQRLYLYEESTSTPYDLYENKEGFILLHSLAYTDDLSGKQMKNCYFYKFNFGYTTVSTLIKSDLQNISDRIKDFEEKTGDQICDI